MTGMQTGTLAFVHLWETTPWQSTLIFMKELFWINEQPLCSLSEVFLIIWTLFSLHATLYQKFIKTFFALYFLSSARPLIFSSACSHLPPQTSIKVIRALHKLCVIAQVNQSSESHSSPEHTHQIFMSGCSRVLMRFTIQLKRRPYRALDIASRTSAALSTVLVRMMVSPLVTTHWEVSASWSSSGPMLRREAARRKDGMVNQFESQGTLFMFCFMRVSTYSWYILCCIISNTLDIKNITGTSENTKVYLLTTQGLQKISIHK